MTRKLTGNNISSSTHTLICVLSACRGPKKQLFKLSVLVFGWACSTRSRPGSVHQKLWAIHSCSFFVAAADFFINFFKDIFLIFCITFVTSFLYLNFFF